MKLRGKVTPEGRTAGELNPFWQLEKHALMPLGFICLTATKLYSATVTALKSAVEPQAMQHYLPILHAHSRNHRQSSNEVPTPSYGFPDVVC